VGGAALAGLRALEAGYKNIKALPIFVFLLHSSYQIIKASSSGTISRAEIFLRPLVS
jgi:hypothetical protein